MNERLRNIPQRILAWWGRFSLKQKTAIISGVAGILIAIGILAFVMTRPNMIVLMTCENTKESSEVTELLTEQGITYDVSDDGLTISINKEDEAAANIALGANDIPTDSFSMNNIVSSSLSTTESDKEKQYKLYIEKKLSRELETMNSIDAAAVSLSIPEDDGTILSKEKKTHASVMLELSGELDKNTISGIAHYVATAIGNDDTTTITIMDSDGNTLFTGDDASNSINNATDQLSFKTAMESQISNKVKQAIIGSSLYDDAQVSPNLVVLFSEREETDHRYYVEEGQAQGYKDSESIYESESVSGVGGVPGTDSNDQDTTYVLEDDNETRETISDTTTKYLPNESITKTKTPAGSIDTENSTIAVVLTQNRIYKEDVLKDNGTLDGMTFDEFIEQNSERTQIDVDESFINMVSKASGIAVENVSVVAYEVPMFVASEGSGRTVTDYLTYILIALIALLLLFVVITSMRREVVEELEPEVSVDKLLETTKATEEEKEELEDIDYNEVSETRRLIEKFVDEKPEAVANLLRNWLNEDWE